MFSSAKLANNQDGLIKWSALKDDREDERTPNGYNGFARVIMTDMINPGTANTE